MISVGTADKLKKFLSLNPEIPESLTFVDDSEDFQAYSAAGFQSITDGVKDGSVDSSVTSRLRPPGLSLRKWIAYLANAASLSLPTKMKLGEVPPSVLRLGGTFVIEGDTVLYSWADQVPGDHPEVQDVLRATKIL